MSGFKHKDTPWDQKYSNAKGKPAEGGFIGAKCGASKRGTDGKETCGHPAGWSTDHPGWGRCVIHGGSTKTGRDSAARLQVRHRMEARYGEEVDIDPNEALLEEVRRTAGHVKWLGDKVKSLEEDDDLTQHTQEGMRGSVWVDLYQTERAMLVKVSKTAVDAGVMERQISLAEDQGALVAKAIQHMLDDLELTDEQLAKAPEIVRGRLLELAPGDVRELD